MKKTWILLLAAALCAASCTKGFGNYLNDAMYETGPVAGGDTDLLMSGGDKFEPVKENSFIYTAEIPVSSFSVDADGASYAYMRRCIINGMEVPAQSVRIE